jgi:hypothetical protein
MRTILSVITVVATFSIVAFPVAAPAQSLALAMSKGSPSPLKIEQHFLEQKQARLEREIRVVVRCIDFSRQHLIDIQGNVNQIARNDLTNCARRLRFLQWRVTRLARAGQRLQFSFRAEALARLQRIAQTELQATGTNRNQ